MNWNDPCVNPKCIEWERQALILRAEVRDLKARLKAARASWFGPSPEQSKQWDEVLLRVTDLRVRNWRKP